jgi:hypothetical protein
MPSSKDAAGALAGVCVCLFFSSSSSSSFVPFFLMCFFVNSPFLIHQHSSVLPVIVSFLMVFCSHGL